MNSLERVRVILNREEPDRPAVIAPVSNATAESCRILGFKFSDVHLDEDKAAALASYPYDCLGFDSVMPYFSIVLEAAALGGEIQWGSEFGMPALRRPLYKEPDDFTMPDDFLNAKPITSLLNALRLLKRRYGGSALIIGKVLGPWTLGLHLYGMEHFLIDTMLDPQKIHNFIGRFFEITCRFAEAQLEAGADMITLADHITADLASPQAYREFLMPFHQKLIRRFPKNTFILHCCGKTTDRIPLFSEAKFPVFHFDSRNDIGEAVRAAGPDMLLTGCVNNPETLLTGSPAAVRGEVLEIMSHGIRLLAPECAMPLHVANENLLAISQAVQLHCRL